MNRLANAVVAQRPQLLFPFSGVARRESRLDVAGVTIQLGHIAANIGFEHANQTLDADLLEMGFAAPLAVEFRKVACPRTTPHVHADPSRPDQYVGQHTRVVMHVVVRIRVSRSAANQFQKAVVLPFELRGDAVGVVRIQFEMDADAQRLVLTREAARLIACRSIDHEARAGEDALAVSLDDPAIDRQR